MITRAPREVAASQLSRMVGTLIHEDFYVSGTWIEESLGLYVGWVARKGSFAEPMPLQNERRDVTIVFAGEEFPAPQTISTLKERGHSFEAFGPSYLPHMYEESESSFLPALNGRFHGIVADRRRDTATLFNDRYGMERLYFSESDNAFYFSAEAKAILSVRPSLRRLDPQSLGEFIACGTVLDNRTLFKGVEVLPPGSAWRFQNGRLESKRAYFDPGEWEEQSILDSEAYYTKLREVFSQNLPRYFSDAQQIAMSLTGGLDSRMIMAWQKRHAGSLPCYTFGGMFRDCRDVKLSRKVAQACGQPHQVIEAGSDFLSRFPYYAERAVYLTDGCVDVSRSPDVYLNEKARQIAPVRMTGNLGGEFLRGVRTLKYNKPSAGLFQAEIEPCVQQAGRTYQTLVGGNPLSFAVFKQTPWNHYGIISLEQTQLSLRTPFLDNELVRTVFQAPKGNLANNDDSLRLIGDGNPDLLRIPTDRGLAGESGSAARAVNRALLEFLFKAEYAYDMGMPQNVARVDHAFASLHLERLFLGRHKVFHFRIWYRDALAQYVQETLLDSTTLSRPYIQPKRLREIVEGHTTGARNYTNEIHQILTLELVHRLFLDDRPGSRSTSPDLKLPVANAVQ